ncbi:unnamed protein product [Arabidopsis lyrata]|nr:unnamed protein product [Arabidopsis lyrata]
MGIRAIKIGELPQAFCRRAAVKGCIYGGWENDDSVREAAVSGRHLQHAEKTGQEEDKSLAS